MTCGNIQMITMSSSYLAARCGSSIRLARKTADLGVAVDAIWSVSEPDGLVMSRQGLAFFRLGPEGCIWHTRRISWDGLKQIHVSSTDITGFAWAPWSPEWTPFTVDLRSGRVQGGSYNGPDASEWEPWCQHSTRSGACC
jgi:hypothetical protein